MNRSDVPLLYLLVLWSLYGICFVLSAYGDDDDDDDNNKNDIGLKFSLMLEGQLDA